MPPSDQPGSRARSGRAHVHMSASVRRCGQLAPTINERVQTMAFDSSQPSYQRLRSGIAERRYDIVPWVGAGLSAPAGTPTWVSLRGLLFAEGENRAQHSNKLAAEKIQKKLQAARDQDSPWRQFSLLRQALGETLYREAIKGAFARTESSDPPENYLRLWRLRPSGLLSLNIDGFAERAFGLVQPGKPLNQLNGKNVAALAHVLQSPQPFLASLHGLANDRSSWVFDKQELKKLVSIFAYKQFISACVLGKTLLFVGISAEDRAAGGHLDVLRIRQGIETGSHFWITNRKDSAACEFAEAAGVQIVHYDAPDDHSALAEILDDLCAAAPMTSAPAPVVPVLRTQLPKTVRKSPSQLEALSAEEIRQELNARAVEILSPGTQDAYETYSMFCEENDEAIHRAWYLSTAKGKNTLFGYTLHEVLGHGAFGTVYRAVHPSFGEVAIKIAHKEVRHSPGRLESFRRGVAAMAILEERQVEGMVPFLERAEIPAYVAMDVVNGPTLREATKSNWFRDWGAILQVSASLASIIRAAHQTPESVLHRDIRPSNVMLSSWDREDWKVVVLDFDLSWHRDAIERSILEKNSITGYLAPEQVEDTGVSTRNAAVDVFGIGMTLFFVCGRTSPMFAQQRHTDWSDKVRAAVHSVPPGRWASIPRRVHRLIENATKDAQGQRWDLAQFYQELKRLLAAERSPGSVRSAELLAEEVVARGPFHDRYHWDEDRLEALISLASGVTVALKASEVKQAIELTIRWNRTGAADPRKISKYLTKRTDAALARLQSGGWNGHIARCTTSEVEVLATLSTARAGSLIERASRSVGEAAKEMELE